MALDAGIPNHSVEAQLRKLTAKELLAPQRVTNPVLADAAMAGIWIRHNFLTEGHHICQDHESDATNNFWHAILHRREGDYWNSKYWFRQVRAHPVLTELASELRSDRFFTTAKMDLQKLVKSNSFHASEFVDLVAKSTGSESEVKRFCEQVQLVEWKLLFAYSCKQATA